MSAPKVQPIRRNTGSSTTAPNSPVVAHLQESERRRFHIPASDERGHNTRKYFRLTDRLNNQIAVIVGSKAFPYRSTDFLIRHAIVRHLEWLRDLLVETQYQKVGNKIITEIGQVDIILQIIQEQEEGERFLSVIERAVTICNGFLIQNHVDQARRFILMMSKQVEAMPQSYWQMKYRQAVTERLWPLVERQPGADLTLAEEGDRGEDVEELLNAMQIAGEAEPSGEEGK